MASIIEDVIARKILDSGGYPAVEVEVLLVSGASGIACAPSGARTDSHEALELCGDGDVDNSRDNEIGVPDAVININDRIAKVLKGFDARNQRVLDQALLDLGGTQSKPVIGGSVIRAISIANARAAAKDRKMPLFAHIDELYGQPGLYSIHCQ
ncbi:MAG: hypothetical protein V7731_10515 [Amphritea sp.]